MYTLKIDDNGCVVTTTRETLMERSNYVDTLQILVDKLYKEQIDMSDATVYMKYHMPVTDKIKMTKLIAADLDYKENYIQYKVPVDAYLTAEAGDIEVSFTFIKLIADVDGTTTSYIRKTEAGVIHITPLAQFDKYEPSEMFSEIDQRLIMLEALQKDLANLSKNVYDEMVRDIRINKEENKLILTNKDGDAGTGVNINEISDSVVQDIVGTDPDNVQDGVIHLDNLDELASIDELLA